MKFGTTDSVPFYVRATDNKNTAYQFATSRNGANFGQIINGEWNVVWEMALKSDLQTIFPSKSYDASKGTFVNFDDIIQSQIASVFISNDGSNKTPTGRDGILLVFTSGWTVQVFFDYAEEAIWRIKWGNWKQWKRISSLSS